MADGWRGHNVGVDVVWFLLMIAGCCALLWISHRIEPHWVSKDGTRFMTMAQQLDDKGQPNGRRHEVRVAVNGDGTLRVGRRRLFGAHQATWRMIGRASQAPRRKATYVLGTVPKVPKAGMLELRLPASSRAIAVLDAIPPDA